MSTTLRSNIVQPILNGVALHLQWQSNASIALANSASGELSLGFAICSLFSVPPLSSLLSPIPPPVGLL